MTAKFRSGYFQLHQNHQLRYFRTLDCSSRKKFYKIIKSNEFATVFSELDSSAQELIIGELDGVYAQKVIDSMRTDEVVRFLRGLEQERINYYLSLLKNHDAGQISMLLTYEENTAGSIMTTEFITATEGDTVAVVLDRLSLVGKDAETIYYIYIVKNSNQLVGVVSLRDLITSPRGHQMRFIMKEYVISVRISDYLIEVLKIIKNYDLLLVPVITRSNELIGIITIDDVMNEKTESSSKIIRQINRKRRTSTLTMLFLGIVLVMLMIRL